MVNQSYILICKSSTLTNKIIYKVVYPYILHIHIKLRRQNGGITKQKKNPSKPCSHKVWVKEFQKDVNNMHSSGVFNTPFFKVVKLFEESNRDENKIDLIRVKSWRGGKNENTYQLLNHEIKHHWDELKKNHVQQNNIVHFPTLKYFAYTRNPFNSNKMRCRVYYTCVGHYPDTPSQAYYS